MSSPCNNMPRLARCRVRDFASCFYACQRLPALDEEETHNSPSSPSKPSHKVQSLDGPTRVVESEPPGGAHKPRKKMSGKNGENPSVRSSSNNLSRNISRVAENGNGSEPSFADEDYIVFCFRDDGRIDIINNEANNNNKSSEACRDVIDDDGHERIICATTLLPLTNGNKGPNDEIKEINSIEQPHNGTQIDSFESCDSKLSDTSSSSFAFPALGIDWIGSPVHMPKSENPEARCLRPHCCKF